MATRGWIPYDWFKLIVALILAALLIILALSGGASEIVPASVETATALAVAAAATPASTGARVPTLGAPASGAQVPAGAASFSGTAEPGSTVRVLIDGRPVGTAIVGTDGTWTLDGTIDTTGPRSVMVETLDAGGTKLNTSAPTVINVVAPATAPATTPPTIEAPSGSLNAGTVSLNGTGTPGQELQVTAGDQVLGTTTVGDDGQWTLPVELVAGTYLVIAQPVNGGTSSQPLDLEIAESTTTQPPTITAPSSPLSAGANELRGTGTPGQQLEILANGQSLGTVTVGADGTWVLPVTLEAGSYELSAKPVDGEASAPIQVAVNAPSATAPAATVPTITFPADGAQLEAGPFIMKGTGAPGTQIEVLDGDRIVGATAVGADGTWSLDVTPSDATAAYSARPQGSTEPPATAIRVTTGVVKTCAALAVGCQAWVTREGGLQLRMRSAPGTSAAIITRLPIGTQMELTEGPQAADGFTWFKVRTEGGEEGWIAGEQVRLQPD